LPWQYELFLFLGGQFDPESSGQFEPESIGQFPPECLVSFIRILHLSVIPSYKRGSIDKLPCRAWRDFLLLVGKWSFWWLNAHKKAERRAWLAKSMTSPASRVEGHC
jgi:hypothetical protein